MIRKKLGKMFPFFGGAVSLAGHALENDSRSIGLLPVLYIPLGGLDCLTGL